MGPKHDHSQLSLRFGIRAGDNRTRQGDGEKTAAEQQSTEQLLHVQFPAQRRWHEGWRVVSGLAVLASTVRRKDCASRRPVKRRGDCRGIWRPEGAEQTYPT